MVVDENCFVFKTSVFELLCARQGVSEIFIGFYVF